MSSPSHCLGIDVARGQWLVASRDSSRPTSLGVRLVPTIALALARHHTVAGIDIPIGLPRAGIRACDLEARRILGGHASSRVFLAPPRGVIFDERPAGSPELQALSRSLTGRGVSAQTLGLRRAIREVDQELMSPGRSAERVVEVHPELSFRAMTGRVLASKHSSEGIAQRVEALTRAFDIDVTPLVESRPGKCGADDVVDALAALWSAERVAAGIADDYGDGERDEHGLLMAIHV